MPTILLRNDKNFSFQSYKEEPTTEQIRSEQENVYRFLEEKYRDLVKQLEVKLQEVETRLSALEP